MSDQTNETAVVNGLQHSRWTLNGLSRDEVKKIALAAHTERNSGESRAFLGSTASKGQLINFILGLPIAEPKQETPPVHASASSGDLAATIATAIAGFLPNGHVNRDEVQAIVDETTETTYAYVDRRSEELKSEFAELISEQAVRRVVVENTLTGTLTDVGFQHERFEALLKRVQIAREAARKYHKYLNVWIVGPAGSGKTTACENVAKALGMNFEFNGALDSEHKLLGFVDAQGRIVSRPFRKAWENGGLYLFDEVDASLPGACLALNAALANGYCDFPDGKIDRNDDCVILASGNVWNGPTEEYVGRYKPDAAFANRFIKFRFDYDEQLERALAGNDQWVDYVQAVRRNVKAQGVKVVISPRASIFGALLLEGGVSWSETVEETLRQGLAQQIWDSISNQGAN